MLSFAFQQPLTGVRDVFIFVARSNWALVKTLDRFDFGLVHSARCPTIRISLIACVDLQDENFRSYRLQYESESKSVGPKIFPIC